MLEHKGYHYNCPASLQASRGTVTIRNFFTASNCCKARPQELRGGSQRSSQCPGDWKIRPFSIEYLMTMSSLGTGGHGCTCPALCDGPEKRLRQAAAPGDFDDFCLTALTQLPEEVSRDRKAQVAHQVHCLCCLLRRPILCGLDCPQDLDNPRKAHGCKGGSFSARTH